MKEIKRTRTIEEIDCYEAFDGKRFTSKEECEKYEASSYGVIAKEFEKLFIRESFPECEIWEHFGYGSEEYEMAIIDIKDENDLFIANRYYEHINNGNIKPESLIGSEYIGKRVLVSLGCFCDRSVYPYPRTWDELNDQFKREMTRMFNPVTKEQKEA